MGSDVVAMITSNALAAGTSVPNTSEHHRVTSRKHAPRTTPPTTLGARAPVQNVGANTSTSIQRASSLLSPVSRHGLRERRMVHTLCMVFTICVSLQCVGVSARGRDEKVTDQVGGQRVAARPHVVYVLTDNLGWGGVGFLRAMSPAGPSREVGTFSSQDSLLFLLCSIILLQI